MDDIENLRGKHPVSLERTPHPEILREHLVLDIDAEERLHLLDYWHVLMKRRWAVTACLMIIFLTVAIGTFRQKRAYRSRVLIEVNPESPDILNFKDVLRVGSAGEIETYRATQIKVLQGRMLAKRVVQTLQLYQDPEFGGQRTISDNGPPDPESDVFRTSVNHFLGSLEAKLVPRTSLVEVSFYSQDPRLAARVANQIASAYVEQNLQAKWDEGVSAAEWLSGQLVGLKARLEKTEDALQAYARANSILFVEEKKNLANTRLEQLQAEYTRAQSERFEKESLLRLVESGSVQDLPGGSSDKLVQEMEGRIAELRREYARLTTAARPEYPGVVQLQRQIDSLEGSLNNQKKNMAQRVIGEYKAALAREKSLAQALEDQKKQVNDIAERSIQYNILKREVDTNRQLYDALLQRLKESQVSAALKASNIRIVETAEVSKQPVRPRVALNLMLGAILGLGLGVGLAFFLEYLDDTIKTADEVETLLRLPALGVIPGFAANGASKTAMGKLVSIAPHKEKEDGEESSVYGIQTNPEAVEAYRSLRASILLSANPVPRTILISSALPSEGKTTTAVNLGATLASLGSKVVIVDCDMRRPRCHRMAGVQNEPGVVQCLTGHVELAEAILEVPNVANLNVIPCGPIPPNPAEILSSPVTAELLRGLRLQFEYVLVDSPPLLSVADGRILAALTDAVVLVVRAHATPNDVVRRAQGLLYSIGVRILGVALNDLNFRRDGYSYNYSSGYGYGYGSCPGHDREHDSISE